MGFGAEPVENADTESGRRKRLADLREIIGVAGEVIVEGVGHRACQQEDVRDHFTLLPASFDALDFAQLFREMIQNFPNCGKCVQSP